MESKQQSKDGAARTRNLLVLISLVLAIVMFVIFPGRPTTSEKGVVTTSILSVRLGDASIEKFNVPTMLTENVLHKIAQQTIKP